MSSSRRPRGRRTWGWFVALVVVVATVLAGTWLTVLTRQGGHLFIVETPSMARTAPVGTLVVTRPVDTQDLRVGDIISFRPPRIDRVYTHRVVAVSDEGLRTQGDLNSSPDGWVVPGDRVIGRAEHLWFGLGWLLRMLPWIAGGLVLTAVLARMVPYRRRAEVWILGASLSTSLALVVVRPLVRAETTGFVPLEGGDGVRMSVIGTGLLPIRATSLDHHSVDVVAGELGWVETMTTDAHGRYVLTPHLYLPWWGWALMALFCLLPLVSALLVARRTRSQNPATGSHDGMGGSDEDECPAGYEGVATRAGAVPAAGTSGAPRTGRTAMLSSAAVLAASALAVLGLTPSQAALTAAVANSSNTLATRPYYTCLDAMQSYRTSSGHNGWLYVGYAMGDGTGVTGTADQQNGTTGPGSWNVSPVAVTTVRAAGGCVSDYARRQQGYVTFNGTTSQWRLPGLASAISNVTRNPGNANNLTWNTWIRTTSTRGGVISCPAGLNSVCADRVTWMTNAGALCFGVSSSMICSPSSYNDGRWHMVTSQISSTKGMVLWIDGAQVATNSSVTGGDAIISYPQWGYSAGSLKSSYSANAPTSLYWQGDMQMVSMIGANSSGTQVGDADVSAIFQSAQP